MKKISFVFLSLMTIAIVVLLVIALTDTSSALFPYRFVIGIALLVIGGFWRRHVLSYNKTKLKE